MSPDDFNEKIELLVNDENRIVTYKILSQELKIHVNVAKKYIMDYWNAQKSKGVNLEVHYFLAGFAEKDGLKAVNVLIVSEDNLEKAKKNFSEITSCHIYSIYKGTSKDEFALYSADFAYTKNAEEHNKYSAIKHPNIEIKPPVLSKIQVKDSSSKIQVKDSSSKIEVKDSSSNSSKQPDPRVLTNGSLSSKPGKDAKVKLTESVSPEENDSPNQTNESKTKKPSPEIKKQKAGTLMSMWQKKEEKSTSSKKENHKPDVKEKEVVKTTPKNNILSMFSKQAEKKAEKAPVCKSTPCNGSPKKEHEIIKKEESPKKVSTNQSRKPVQKRKLTKNKKSSRSKNSSDSENESQPKAKKHRRICTFDDSDSESENEEEKERAQRSFFLPEDPMETSVATPVSDDEPIPPTPPVAHTKGKARVWKTVQKTYEDEDGFFVTKKEKELVSTSEDEENPIENKTVKKSEEVMIKKNLTVNKKQSSLMSFFKQK